MAKPDSVWPTEKVPVDATPAGCDWGIRGKYMRESSSTLETVLTSADLGTPLTTAIARGLVGHFISADRIDANLICRRGSARPMMFLQRKNEPSTGRVSTRSTVRVPPDLALLHR